MDSVSSLISRHTHHIQNITTLLRYTTALAFWSTAHLPNAARSSANVVIHVIVPVLMDLRFLFLVSNLIILSLFLSRPSSVLPKPNAQTEGEKEVEAVSTVDSVKDEEAVLMVDSVKEEEAVSVVEPGKEKKTKKHALGTLRRTRSLATTAVVRMRMATELWRAQTSLKNEKEIEEKQFRDVVEAFIEKQRKFSEDENNHASP